MATYGYDQYGHAAYGAADPTGNYPGSQITIPVVNTAYIFPGLQAQVQNYQTILVSWGQLNTGTNNTVTEFRLLTNTWGFPVDQNDGTVVIDVTGTPPSYPYQYTDQAATPGKVQYYGIYVLSGGVWLRGGFTACLLPKYHAYDVKLMSDLPAFFQNQDLGYATADVQVAAPNLPSSGGSAVNPYSYTVDVWLSSPANVSVNSIPIGVQTFFTLPAGGTVTITYPSGTFSWQWVARAQQPVNNALSEYLSIVAMALDLVKSQYDMKFDSLNNPMLMSLGDLANFCAEIGLPYNPEIPAYTMRKAAAFWGQVMQQRGTLVGIAEHITLLTGYQVDLQNSRNIMLDDDQSVPADPVWPNWQANTKYNVGEHVIFPVAQLFSIVSTYNIGSVVQYNDLFYTCTVNGTSGILPTVTSNWNQNVNGPYLYYCLVANENNQPSGGTGANTWWSCVYGGNQNGSEFSVPLVIPDIGNNAGTWEYLNSNNTHYSEGVNTGFPTPQTWPQGAGSPTTGPNGYSNTFKALNNTGGTVTNTWLRSVSRASTAVTVLNPDPQLAVQHAVPFPNNVQAWSATTVYPTGSVVSYQNINYIALRQSKGATPPGQQIVLNANYDFETGVTPWVAGTGATVTQSAAQAYHGTHSMQLVTTGATQFATAEIVPTIPGATYVASGLVFTSGAGVSSQVFVNWLDEFNGFINGDYPSDTALTASTWTAISVVFTTPVNCWGTQLGVGNLAAATTFWDLVELTCIATPEWAPLGQDTRIPVTLSGYGITDLGFAPTANTAVTPFVEWYDSWGNLITRVFARSPSTSGGYPTNYQFDAFDTGANFPLAGRVPAIPNVVWSVPAGNWTIGSDGNVYAGTSAADALAVVPSPAAGTSAATVTTASAAGDDCGPLWWYSNTSNFWVAGLLQMYWVASGTTHTLAYTGTLPAVGDRLYAEFNNTTSTTTMPDGTHTVIGPSVIIYKNTRATSNILVVVGSGGTQTQTAMSSLTGAFLPSTGATASNAGIASIAV